jgi:hypothetical protein
MLAWKSADTLRNVCFLLSYYQTKTGSRHSVTKTALVSERTQPLRLLVHMNVYLCVRLWSVCARTHSRLPITLIFLLLLEVCDDTPWLLGCLKTFTCAWMYVIVCNFECLKFWGLFCLCEKSSFGVWWTMVWGGRVRSSVHVRMRCSWKNSPSRYSRIQWFLHVSLYVTLRSDYLQMPLPLT